MEKEFNITEDNTFEAVENIIQITSKKEEIIPEYKNIDQEKYFLDFPLKNVLFFPRSPIPTYKCLIDDNQGYCITEILEGILKSQQESIPFNLIFSEENNYKIMSLISLDLVSLNKIMKNVHQASENNYIAYENNSLFFDLGYKFRLVTKIETEIGNCVQVISELTLLRSHSKSCNSIADSFVVTYFNNEFFNQKYEEGFSEVFLKSSSVELII